MVPMTNLLCNRKSQYILFFILICYFFRKDAFFVDLFVRMSNNVAVDMYKQLGYVIYRRVLEYYSGDPDEDAYGEKLKRFNPHDLFCFKA